MSRLGSWLRLNIFTGFEGAGAWSQFPMRAIITFEWSRVLATSSPRMTKGKVVLGDDEGKDEVESSQLREERRTMTNKECELKFIPTSDLCPTDVMGLILIVGWTWRPYLGVNSD